MSQNPPTPVEWVDLWTPADGAARVRAAFAQRFATAPDGGPSSGPGEGPNGVPDSVPDDAPDGVWSAPGRVNVIGEHTDYNAGLCLPMALPHRTYVALRRRDDDVVRLASAQEESAGVWTGRLAEVGPGTVDGWVGYAVGVAWALRQAGHDVGGFDAVVDSCVPYGAGLSSSAALECAVAVALDEVHGLGLAGSDAGRMELVAACIRAENEIAGAATGGLDQSASLRCRDGHALLLDTRDGSARHIPFDLSAHGLALLVIDTRAGHQHNDGQYASRRATCERAAAALGLPSLREIVDLDQALEELEAAGVPDLAVTRRRVRHVVTENARVEQVENLLARDEVEAVGAVLTAAHVSLRDDYEVSCHELDVAVDAAIAAGALGGRMVGGGFGGSAVALVRVPDVGAVTEAVARAFADTALGTPAFLLATPAGPAGRS